MIDVGVLSIRHYAGALYNTILNISTVYIRCFDVGAVYIIVIP